MNGRSLSAMERVAALHLELGGAARRAACRIYRVNFPVVIRQRWSLTRVTAMALTFVWITACTGGVSAVSSSSDNAAGSTPYTVGGTVSGLAGTGLVLQNNGGNNLSVAADGTFTFSTTLVAGNPFNVSVLAQPSGPTQTCVPSNATGTVASTNVTNVTISCTIKTAQDDTVGGTVTGLLGSGLVLQDNGSDNLSIGPPGGTFTFATPLPSGGAYSVTVQTQPSNPKQTCVVSAGAGTTGSADVNNVSVACAVNSTSPTNPLVVALSGLPANGYGSVLLQDNLGDSITATTNRSYQFATLYAIGSAFSVTAVPSDAQQSLSCSISPPNGIVSGSAGAAVDVLVSCSAPSNFYTVSVNVSIAGGGALGAGLQIQDNNGDTLAIASIGTFTFATPIATGSAYDVTVLSQPTNQPCTVSGATGTVGAANIASVNVVCAPSTYPVGGTISVQGSGALGSGLQLQDNRGDTLVVTAAGAFTFPTQIAAGGAYSVTVLSQPANPSQTCTVANPTGTISATTSVSIACVTNAYSIGVTVTAPQSFTGALALLNNATDPLSLTANSACVAATGTAAQVCYFPTPVASGLGYSVTIQTQPGTANAQNQHPYVCTTYTNPQSASGTVGAAAVTVAITCVQPLAFAYVTDDGDFGLVSPYVVSSAGLLTQFGPAATTGSGPIGLAVDPATFYSNLYTVNQNSNNISQFAVDPDTGALANATGSPFSFDLAYPTSITAGNLELVNIENNETTPLNVLYVTNAVNAGQTTQSYISTFSIGTNGALTSMGNTAMNSSASLSVAATLLPSASEYYGAYYTANSNSGNISEFTVSPTGTLNEITGSPLATGATQFPQPSSIASLSVFNGTSVVFVENEDGSLWSYSAQCCDFLLTPESVNGGAFYTFISGGGLLTAMQFNYTVAANTSDATNVTSAYVFATGNLQDVAQGGSLRNLVQFNVPIVEGVLTPASITADAPVAVGGGDGRPWVAAFAGNDAVYVFVATTGTIAEFASPVNTSTGLLQQPVLQGTFAYTDTPSSIIVVPRPYVLNVVTAVGKAHR